MRVTTGPSPAAIRWRRVERDVCDARTLSKINDFIIERVNFVSMAAMHREITRPQEDLQMEKSRYRMT